MWFETTPLPGYFKMAKIVMKCCSIQHTIAFLFLRMAIFYYFSNMLEKSYKIVYGFRNGNSKFLNDAINLCASAVCEKTNYPFNGVKQDLLNKIDHDWSIVCLDKNVVVGAILMRVENCNDVIVKIQSDRGEISEINENVLEKYNNLKGIHGLAFAVDKNYRNTSAAWQMVNVFKNSKRIKQNFDYVTASQSEYFSSNINYHSKTELVAVLTIFSQNISLFVKKLRKKSLKR